MTKTRAPCHPQDWGVLPKDVETSDDYATRGRRTLLTKDLSVEESEGRQSGKAYETGREPRVVL